MDQSVIHQTMIDGSDHSDLTKLLCTFWDLLGKSSTWSLSGAKCMKISDQLIVEGVQQGDAVCME